MKQTLKLPQKLASFATIFSLVISSLLAITGNLFLALPAHAANPLTVSQTLTTDLVNADTKYWPVGARVCNTSAAYTYSITSTFRWTTSLNDQTISLVGNPNQSLGTLGLTGTATACKDVYYQIYIPLNSNAAIAAGQLQTKKYVIDFTTGATANADNSGNPWTISTSSNRQIYIEPNVQLTNNLNITSMTTSAPLDTVAGVTRARVEVGKTYTFTISANTGTNVGWVQISAFFDPAYFQILSASGEYTAANGGTINGVIKNACGMIFDTSNANYRSCANNSKITDTPALTYTVLVKNVGTQATFPTNITGFYNTQTKFQGVTGSGISAIDAYWPLSTTAKGAGSITAVTTSGTLKAGSASVTCTAGNTCDSTGGTYTDGSVVTLTAAPATGQDFSGWGGSCQGTSTTCVVTMNQARTVTALFATGTYLLSVNFDGLGTGSVTGGSPAINCANTGGSVSGTCVNSYTGGTSVTLTATPDPKMLFVGWSGACTGTSTCVVTVNSATNVIATFDIDPELTVKIASTSGSKTVTSNVGGINCVSDNANGTTGTCIGNYSLNQQVVLTATATPLSWLVSPSSTAGVNTIVAGCGANSTSCTVRMAVNSTVYAVYGSVPVSVVIDSASTGSGYVSSSDSNISNCGGLISPVCSFVYAANTSVTLTNYPDAGSTFTGWTITGATPTAGTCTSSSLTCAFSTTTPTTVVAQFSMNTTLSLSTTTGGTISGSPALSQSSGTWTQTYSTSPHQTVTLTATPNTGYSFTGWSNGPCSGTGTCTITMDSNYSITANFAINSYTVAYNGNGSDGGSAPASVTQNYNTTFTVSTAGTLTRTGYTFAGWNTAANGSGTAYAAGSTYTITAAGTLYAQWTINSYTVAYNGNGSDGGSAPASVTQNYNTTFTVSTAGTLTRSGYTFAGWNTAANGSGTAYAAGSTYTITAAGTLYAQWSAITYTITYDGNGSDGGTAPTAVSQGYNTSFTVSGAGTLTRSGSPAYTFVGWNTAANGSGTSYAAGSTYTITADATLFAQWTQAATFTITVTQSANGTITPGTASYLSGSNQTFTITPDTGYSIASLTTDLGAITPVSGTYTFSNITANHTITATYSINSYTITYDGNSNTGGTAPNSVTQNYNTTFSASGVGSLTKSGKSFVNWNTLAAGGGTTYTPGTTYTITGNLTLFAQWTSLPTYTITVTQGANGTISPATADYISGDHQTFTITPNTGYHIVGVIVDGDDKGAVGTYSFVNILAAHSVTATYAANSYTITYDGNGNTGGTAPTAVTQDYNTTFNTSGKGTLVRSGYTFGSWNSLANGSGAGYATGASYTILDNATLYAQWVNNSYTLTYNAGTHGSIAGATSQTVTAGANGSAVTPMPAAGYYFVNWSDGSTATPRSDLNVNTNITVTANFAALPTYQVSYFDNVATENLVVPTDPSFYYSGNFATVSVTEPSRTGYTFGGWTLNSANTGTIYKTGVNILIPINGANVALYALWNINSYTITYSPGTGGIGAAPATPTSALFGTTFILPPNSYTRTGYSFIGWSNGTTTYLPGATYPSTGSVNANVNLTALWNINSYTITYSPGTGGIGAAPTNPISAQFGTTFILPPNSYTRSGYSFIGWSNGTTTYLAGATYPSTGSVNSNVNLTALWQWIPLPPSIFNLSADNICADGSNVTIYGTNLSDVMVKVDGIGIPVLSQTGTAVTISLVKASAGDKTITVSNPDGSATTHITYIAPVTPEFQPISFAQMYQNRAFAHVFSAYNTTHWSTTESLPSGLVLDSNTGLIYGTPEVQGLFTVYLKASNICRDTTVPVTFDIDKPIPGAFSCRVTYPVNSLATLDAERTLQLIDCFTEIQRRSPRTISPVIYMMGGLKPYQSLRDSVANIEIYNLICEMMTFVGIESQVITGVFTGYIDEIELFAYWPEPVE